MKRKAIYIAAAILLFSASAAVFTVWHIMYRNNTIKESVIYINEKSSPDEFFQIAEASGSVKNLTTLRYTSKIEKLSVAEPGRYIIKPGMGNREIVRMVKFGWQTPVKLTISGNIRTKERLAGILSRNIRPDSLSILNMLNNDSLAESFGFNKATFIGMFIPNTYEVFWTITSEDIARRFKREFDSFWSGERVEKAKNIGLTPVQVITLASIVTEESNVREEYPVIAGVYLNRIKKGMPLQADPTVKYAVGDFSLKRVLHKHLESNSPYNTYKHPGLPPGPITIPSAEVIDGVLNRAKHNYLYFCAKATLDGTHAFSETLAQHNRYAKAYQAALNRLKIR